MENANASWPEGVAPGTILHDISYNLSAERFSEERGRANVCEARPQQTRHISDARSAQGCGGTDGVPQRSAGNDEETEAFDGMTANLIKCMYEEGTLH
jgi:hypothetical protein